MRPSQWLTPLGLTKNADEPTSFTVEPIRGSTKPWAGLTPLMSPPPRRAEGRHRPWHAARVLKRASRRSTGTRRLGRALPHDHTPVTTPPGPSAADFFSHAGCDFIPR